MLLLSVIRRLSKSHLSLLYSPSTVYILFLVAASQAAASISSAAQQQTIITEGQQQQPDNMLAQTRKTHTVR